MIVDDDAFMLSIQSAVLRAMGYRNVVTACSGEVGLARVGNDLQAVDVIICDVNMPGMDGIEFLQILNAAMACSRSEDSGLHQPLHG